ncbi:hypothetical protein [Streptomyces sp. CS131]|nr:hypothetical protein [Streptomyces sp. CS131]
MLALFQAPAAFAAFLLGRAPPALVALTALALFTLQPVGDER